MSKALNGHSDIGEDTRKRVAEVAREMGYVPNAVAKALKTDRTYNIGVLFVDEAGSGLTHDYFSHVLDGFKRQVEEAGYDLTFISNNKNNLGRTSYMEHVRFRRFDGVCIACVDFSNPEVLELVQGDIPVITIDHIFDNTAAVISDNVGGMKDLVRYVFGRGHRKVAYIHGVSSAVTTARLTSFYRTAQEYGIEIPDEYVLEAPYRDTKSAYERTLELLDLPEPPSCILYPDDFAAFGGINAIKEMGLRIPQDISVVGYDGIRIARHIEPTLTTLHQDTEELGKRAGEKLINLIEQPKTTLIEQIIVEGYVYEGNSVADLNCPDS